MLTSGLLSRDSSPVGACSVPSFASCDGFVWEEELMVGGTICCTSVYEVLSSSRFCFPPALAVLSSNRRFKLSTSSGSILVSTLPSPRLALSRLMTRCVACRTERPFVGVGTMLDSAEWSESLVSITGSDHAEASSGPNDRVRRTLSVGDGCRDISSSCSALGVDACSGVCSSEGSSP